MGKYITYKEGELVGNCLYLREVESIETGADKRPRRKARFVCKCGEIFECLIDMVKDDGQCCADCGKQKWREQHITHGNSETREYRVWGQIKSRCFVPSCKNYKNYGGRGITMCKEWADSFQSFIDYMGTSPSKEHSIDRIDNEGNYEPGNVRWATIKEQSYNKRSTVRVTYKGETNTLEYFADKFGMKLKVVRSRYERYVNGISDWTIENIFEKPLKKYNR